MIPSRRRLDSWQFAPILAAADTIKSRGAAIESAASSIEARCNELPALKAWRGEAHDAAESAFRRAKTHSITVGDLADDLSAALTQGYWTLTAAKTKLTNKVADIESEPFIVRDSWAITLRGGDMSAEEAQKRIKRRDALQADLNPLVTAMGRADDTVGQDVADAAAKQGFVMPKPNAFALRTLRPNNEVPDPMTPPGRAYQKLISDADAATSVREVKETGRTGNSRTVTVFMQDGSRILRTRSRLGLSGGRGEYNLIREQHLDAEGKPLWSTDITWKDNERPTVRSNYGAVTVTTTFDEHGRPTTSVRTPTETLNLGSKLMGHPTVQQVNGIIRSPFADGTIAAAEEAADVAGMAKISAGAKYGGMGLATALALGDVITADYGQDICKATIKSSAGLVGGWAAGSAGAAVPIPYVNVVLAGAGAGAGTYGGGKFGEWVGNLICVDRIG